MSRESGAAKRDLGAAIARVCAGSIKRAGSVSTAEGPAMSDAEKDVTCQVCRQAAYTVDTYQGARSWHRDATLNYSPIKGAGHRVIPSEETKP